MHLVNHNMTDTPPAPAAVPASPWNLPNAITFSRLVLSVVLLALISRGDLWITCTVVFIVAVSTDALDGYLARRWNQITTLGRIMDPLVDKIIIGGTMIFLTAVPHSGIGAWTTFIVIGREMFVTALRSVLEGQGVDFSAKFTGKLKMVMQSVALPVCLVLLSPAVAAWSIFGSLQIVRNVLVWLMIAITLYSGLEYAWRGWQLLRKHPGEAA